MPSRRQALATFVAPLQRAFSCITRGVLVAAHGVGELYALQLQHGSPVALGRESGLLLNAMIWYRLAQDPSAGSSWQVRVAGYSYGIDTHDGQELLSYHGHPEGRSPIRTHLHVGAGARVAHTRLATAHLPTGYVPVQDVIWLLIDELGVAPRRPDWREVLTTTRRLAPKGA